MYETIFDWRYFRWNYLWTKEGVTISNSKEWEVLN